MHLESISLERVESVMVYALWIIKRIDGIAEYAGIARGEKMHVSEMLRANLSHYQLVNVFLFFPSVVKRGLMISFFLFFIFFFFVGSAPLDKLR